MPERLVLAFDWFGAIVSKNYVNEYIIRNVKEIPVEKETRQSGDVS